MKSLSSMKESAMGSSQSSLDEQTLFKTETRLIKQQLTEISKRGKEKLSKMKWSLL
jgi:hypothetical protein